MHPRVPPLVRSLPHVESLSLFRAEEPQEEIEAREELGLQGAFPDLTTLTTMFPVEEDTRMSSPKIKDVALAPSNPPLLLNSSSLLVEPSALPQDIIRQISQPLKSSAPPRQELLPTKTPISANLPRSSTPLHSITAPVEEDDEEMPAIDLESDSDED